MKTNSLVLLIAFSAALCSKPPAAASSKPLFDTQITEKYWKLTVIPGYTIQTGFIREPHIILRSNATSFKGNGGCNAFSGTYTTGRDEVIGFSQIISGSDTCAAMETEQVFLKILEDANRFKLIKDTFLLFRDDQALARFEVVYFK